MSAGKVSSAAAAAFQRDGAVVLRGVFSADWQDVMSRGIERNMRHPSEFASENSVVDGAGRFFDYYVNWGRIPEYEAVVRDSPAARIAAEAMGSATAQLFHDHVLVKEAGTRKPTPWHQDAPYYFVDGEQTVSMWMPLEPVTLENTLRFIKGSHKWKKMVRPVSWADDSDFYEEDEESQNMWVPVPDPDGADRDTMNVLEWEMEPGDAVLFHFRTAHGARGSDTRRRALSLRWVGDDASYVERPGRTSPPFPGHNMQEGDRLREDWFPVLYHQEDV
jgi:ectoine hydroxylase-related dioxygenase (phytanoyl-CoA dioxygenase family)